MLLGLHGRGWVLPLIAGVLACDAPSAAAQTWVRLFADQTGSFRGLAASTDGGVFTGGVLGDPSSQVCLAMKVDVGGRAEWARLLVGVTS